MKKRVLSGILALVLALSLCASGYAAEVSFPDAKGHWAEETITTLATQGIVCGYPDGAVRPDDTISRAEFAVLTARVFEYKGPDAAAPFDDLAGCWAKPEITALTTDGIILVSEYSGSFAPKEFITRGEMIRILVRAIDGGKNCHDDESYAKAAMGYGVLKGYPDGSLGLDNTATRAEVFTMLLRTQAAKADCDKKAEKKTLVPTGGGGGYYVPPVPAAELSFALPETAYVGESAVVEAAITGAVSVTWKLTVNGTKTALPEDFKESGGELTFTEAGTYTLTGTAKNSAGKKAVCTHSVTVYPVVVLTLELPAVAHTDAAVSAVLTGELCGLPVTWSLTKNGEAAELTDCIEGALSDAGGELRFMDKGVYRLTATVTDALGREFSASADVTAYPVGSAGFYFPDIFHTDDTVTVEAAFGEIGESFAVWTLTRDGAPVTLEAALTNGGGQLTVGKSGEYVLTASFTDAGRRTYSYNQSFKVYPVPVFTFTFDTTAHTDTDVSVKTT
ncbi:MAG: S-layer homology domain-containing protein, partial [Oscillospiraceae bacterium]